LPPGGVVENFVRGVPVVAHASAEERLIFQGVLEFVILLTEHVGGGLEDTQTKSAGDVQAYGPGDHRVAHSEHTSNGQPVANVGVGHQGATGRNR
jgi:hypothetical protein